MIISWFIYVYICLSMFSNFLKSLILIDSLVVLAVSKTLLELLFGLNTAALWSS